MSGINAASSIGVALQVKQNEGEKNIKEKIISSATGNTPKPAEGELAVKNSSKLNIVA